MRKWIGCISAAMTTADLLEEEPALCRVCPDRTVLRSMFGGWPIADMPDCVMDDSEKGTSGNI